MGLIFSVLSICSIWATTTKPKLVKNTLKSQKKRSKKCVKYAIIYCKTTNICPKTAQILLFVKIKYFGLKWQENRASSSVLFYLFSLISTE